MQQEVKLAFKERFEEWSLKEQYVSHNEVCEPKSASLHENNSGQSIGKDETCNQWWRNEQEQSLDYSGWKWIACIQRTTSNLGDPTLQEKSVRESIIEQK